MLIYPDAQILDITGPLEVFSRTARWLNARQLTSSDAYDIQLVAQRAGPVRCSNGIELIATRDLRDEHPVETLMICGGPGYRAAMDNADLVAWIKKFAPRARRIASVCTGVFLLAKAGLLEHRRVTAHREYVNALARFAPNSTIDTRAMYVHDGNIFTSGGASAGTDMALAMVEHDWGSPVTLSVARELVLFFDRHGDQPQYSRLLGERRHEGDRISDLKIWIAENIDKDLSLEKLAARMAMSERNFSRHFFAVTHVTPARYVEQVRVESARRKLEEGNLPLEKIAVKTGFSSAEHMRRSFQRLLGVPPSVYRERFHKTA
ncbi:MAG: GlxA family transcriptional regulator [Gammaproteobacteria bacterium]|nr:GlxA family transcriptional regulator [Gammaproteobacteria bacterium]